jgi:hypothetical protein
MFQYNHIPPHGIGTAFLLFPQEIFEIVDKRQVQLFKRYILPVAGRGKELPDVFADGAVAAKSSMRPDTSKAGSRWVSHCLFSRKIIL